MDLLKALLVVYLITSGATAQSLESDPTLPIENSSDSSMETFVEKATPEKKDMIDNANDFQEGLSRTVFGLADSLDSFFGEKRADDESNKSTLRLVHSIYESESGSHDSQSQLRLNLRLKNLEKIGENIQNKIENFFKWEDEPVNKETSNETNLDKSKQLARSAIKKWNINWENRVGYRRSIDLYSILRARRNFQGENIIHRFYQEFGWSTENEWQANNSFNSDIEMNKDYLFRWVNEFNWAMTKKTFTTAHGPSLFQHIDNFNSISYNGRFLSAIDGTALYGDGYSVGVSFRRQFTNKWLFLEISPQASFPRSLNYHRDLNLTIQLEAYFGSL